MIKRTGYFSCLTLLAASFACGATAAQEKQLNDTDKQAEAGKAAEAGNTTDSLQKATQNPVANLISVPVQNNSNFGIDPFGRTQDVLNIQPVIPVKLNDRWNLITRIIQPVVWQPYPAENTGGEYGFGDMNPSFFLSPGKPGKLIWGAGPALVIPTATNDLLGREN